MPAIDEDKRRRIDELVRRGFAPGFLRRPAWQRLASLELAVLLDPEDIAYVNGAVTGPDGTADSASGAAHTAFIDVWTMSGLLVTIHAKVEDGRESHTTTVRSRGALASVDVQANSSDGPWEGSLTTIDLYLRYTDGHEVHIARDGRASTRWPVETFLASLLEDVKAGGRG